MFASCGASTVKIGNLEVMTKDLGNMNWYDAKNACEKLGDGWRLPTKDELNILFEHKEKIGGFDSLYGYWTSTGTGVNLAWYSYPYPGGANYATRNKLNTSCVRAVRAF